MKEYVKVLVVLIIVLIIIAVVAQKTGFASNTIKKVKTEDVATTEYVVEDTERNNTHYIHVKGCKSIQGSVTSLGKQKSAAQAKSSARAYYGNVSICSECTNNKFDK